MSDVRKAYCAFMIVAYDCMQCSLRGVDCVHSSRPDAEGGLEATEVGEIEPCQSSADQGDEVNSSATMILLL